MIFIDAIARLQTKAVDRNFLKLRASHKHIHQEDDTVEISEAANNSIEIKLDESHTAQLTASMSITGLLIQTALEYLTQQPAPIVSLQELALKKGHWQLEVQRPPSVSPLQETTYSQKSKAKRNSQVCYPFQVSLMSTNKTRIEFHIIIEVSRSLIKSHNWSNPGPDAIVTTPIQTPYNQSFLTSQPQQQHFQMDQDGELDQIDPILSLARQPIQSTKTPPNRLFAGLRVWQRMPHSLTLVLLGNEKIGGLFVENITPQLGDQVEINEDTGIRNTPLLDIKA